MHVVIIFAAKYFFLLSIILLVIFFFKLAPNRRKKFIIFSLSSFVLSFALAKILSVFFNDPRPFVTDHITPLIAHAADNGFPSDHTLLTMTIAAVVFVYNRKLGIMLAIISLVVGYSRVLAGIHHVVDIVGAIGIAIVAITITNLLVKKRFDLQR